MSSPKDSYFRLNSLSSHSARSIRASVDEVYQSLTGEDVVGVGTPVHINTVGVHMPRESMILLRPFNEEEVPSSILNFSSVSDPKTIRKICVEKVPGWGHVDPDHLVLSQLCEGLSNQIFKVSLPTSVEGSPVSSSAHTFPYTCVLFRVHGKDSNTLYDTSLELEIFKALSKYQIGPQLIAHDTKDKAWRIEEWHYSVTVPCRALPNPSIFGQVASALGRFHKLNRRRDFPAHFPTEPATLKRLKTWAENASKVKFDDQTMAKSLSELNVAKMVKEAEWLHEYIAQRANEPHTTGEGLDVVFSHNDCQENNLLQTQYGLRMIDFEYAHFNYQAYDIGNFFVEFTMDYTEKSYPFFSTDLSAYPDIEKRRLFAAVYLSEYLETPVMPSDRALIDPLLENVRIMELASHLKWGLWSVIRSPQASTYDQFDFLLYAKFRFDCYLRQKKAITHGTSNTTSSGDIHRDHHHHHDNTHNHPRKSKPDFWSGNALIVAASLGGLLASIAVIKLFK